jgi:DNA-binding MarR family transcriptional regulator
MAVDIETLGRAIKQAQWGNHRALDTRLHAIGSTLVQWDALRAIAISPGASAHDLAGATFQSDQAFGTLANRLVRQGLIERRPGHGRRIAHHLTPSGEATLSAGRQVAREVFTEVFSQLSDRDRRQLLKLLDRLTTSGRAAAPGTRDRLARGR